MLCANCHRRIENNLISVEDLNIVPFNEEIYFQREDWRGTHNCVALNNSNVGELYIDIYYEDNRYAQGYEMKYKDGEVPIDVHPFIPTYADMFIHSWIVYKGTGDTNGKKEAYFDSCSI